MGADRTRVCTTILAREMWGSAEGKRRERRKIEVSCVHQMLWWISKAAVAALSDILAILRK